MRLTARITGPMRLLARLGEIQNVMFLAVDEQLEISAMAIHRDAVKSIAAKGSGSRTEVRYNPRREQKVSEPGSPPNQDLGDLSRSVKFEIDKAALQAVVGTNLKKGKHLEIGTTQMEARPWLFPAFEKNREAIKEAIANALRRSIKGAAS